MVHFNSFRFWQKSISLVLIFSLAIGPEFSYAQGVFVATLPEPGVMVGASAAFVPVLVKGLVIHPNKPLNFDFIVDSGNDSIDQAVIKEQSERIARYFLAAVTVPEDQLWVNLSPYEKDRIIENDLGNTVLGRDMLAQDYVLKQLTASLVYPEKGLGRDFWAKVYKQAQEKFGTTDIPVDTFNKVWIMPDKAEVFEKGNAVYVTQAKLKVMLDTDYLAAGVIFRTPGLQSDLAKQVLREVVLPAIEKEVNEGKNFSTIRQVYHAAILAKWYRELIQNTLLASAYVGQNRVAGVTSDEKALKEAIYQRYIAAYKKGVFSLIKEEPDSTTGETVPRKYFSGGEQFNNIPLARTDNAAAVDHSVGKTFKVGLAMNRSADVVMEREVDNARLLMPKQDYGAGASLDTGKVIGLIRRSAKQVIALLKDAKRKGVKLQITGYLRGLDGAGSSLDLPEFQKSLTPQGVQGFNQVPSTTAVASDKKATVRFELADDPNVIEYVAPDYGIPAEAPVRFFEDVPLTDKGRLPKGQVDAVGYVFRDLFGLRGIRIVMEGISPIALAGGMESSNTFNVALLAAGSMLSGANLSFADIVALAVKLENDEFGGLTGGQGHWSTVLGSGQRLVWMSGVKDANGKFVNNYGVVAQEVLSDGQLDAVERHTMLVQAGKEYIKGNAVKKRTAALTNNMWTDLLRLDSVGKALHTRKIALAAMYAEAMAKGDFQTVMEALNEYVDIRDAITMRWINLMMDAKAGLDVSATPYAHEFARRVFASHDAEEAKDYEIIRELYEQHSKAGTLEALRELSLYSLDPISSLIRKAREADIAIFPLGAGGPGSNMMAVSPRGLDHMRKFFESVQDAKLGNIPEITEDVAARIVKGTGVLRGYMPFKVGREGIKIEGFDQLDHVTKPALPEKGLVTGMSVNFDAAMSAGMRRAVKKGLFLASQKQRKEVSRQLEEFDHPWAAAKNELKKRGQRPLAVYMEQLLYRIMPRLIQAYGVSSVQHTGHVVNFAVKIGLKELAEGRITKSGLKILLISALFHDSGLAEAESKAVESEADNEKDPVKKLAIIEASILGRKAHMEISRKYVEKLLKREKGIDPLELGMILRIVEHHDDMKIPLMIKRKLKIPEAHLTQEAFEKESRLYLLTSEKLVDGFDWLMQLHWEADTLWMDCPEGIVADIERAKSKKKTPKEPVSQFFYNDGLHREAADVFKEVLGAEAFAKYGFKETLYRSKEAVRLFQEYRQAVLKQLNEQINALDAKAIYSPTGKMRKVFRRELEVRLKKGKFSFSDELVRVRDRKGSFIQAMDTDVKIDRKLAEFLGYNFDAAMGVAEWAAAQGILLEGFSSSDVLEVRWVAVKAVLEHPSFFSWREKADARAAVGELIHKGKWITGRQDFYGDVAGYVLDHPKEYPGLQSDAQENLIKWIDNDSPSFVRPLLRHTQDDNGNLGRVNLRSRLEVQLWGHHYTYSIQAAILILNDLRDPAVWRHERTVALAKTTVQRLVAKTWTSAAQTRELGIALEGADSIVANWDKLNVKSDITAEEWLKKIVGKALTYKEPLLKTRAVAVMYGHSEVFGAPVVDAAMSPEAFELFSGAKSGDEGMVVGNVNKQDANGTTSLIMASVIGKAALVQALLGAGADVNLGNNNGMTPLMAAAYSGHTDIVKVLVAKGAQVNVQQDDGWTPLMGAAHRRHKEIVKFLLEKGAELNARNKDGMNALILAGLGESQEVMDLLIEKGSVVNIQDKKGVTALMLAAMNGYEKTVETLIYEGAEVNLKMFNGLTALMLASQRGRKDVVAFLLGQKAEVNAKTITGSTAFDCAIQAGQQEIAGMLVAAGGTPGVIDNAAAVKPELFDVAVNGGIDIQNINVTHKGGSTRIRFDDDAVRAVIQDGFNGFTPVIINITPAQSPLMILGEAEAEAENSVVSSS